MIFIGVVSFILGIVFEKYLAFGWSVALLIFLISMISFFFLRGSQGQSLKKILLIAGIAFALGILRMDFSDSAPDGNLLPLAGEKISFEATVSDEPDVRDTSARYTVSFAEEDFDSKVLLVAGRYPELGYGDRIMVSGRLDVPKNFTSEKNGIETGEFDYVSYLAKDNIHFIAYNPKIEKLESGGGNRIIASLYSLKKVLIQKISAVVPEPNSSLLSGVIFGVKQSLGEKLLDDFKRAGLIHVIVLSGYNITIIAVGIFYLTSNLGKRNLGFIIGAASIVLFSVMVGLGATVIRACVMALIAILAKYLGRPADALRWLFMAGLLMLVWNPLVLFYDPSFQLSFMATLGLILFPQIIDEKLISPVLRFIKIKNTFVNAAAGKAGLREIVASTIAVQIFVLPLLIKMSGFVSIVSFAVNPIVLPLVPYAMGFGALTGMLGLLPFAGGIISWPFGVIAYFITQLIIAITEFSVRLPAATLQTGALSLFAVFLWYLVYGFAYWKLRPRPQL